MINEFNRFLILLSLALVLFAYSPTLSSDYVTQDQWRAFRYSVSPQTRRVRQQECKEMITQFYTLTGRPLVWLGEWLEHTIVARIEDFGCLRPFVLLLVLITVLYVGTIVGKWIDSIILGVIAISLFILTPGYSFIYFQGMTGAPVLLGIILAAASFSKFNQWLCFPQQNKFKILVSGILFIMSCMIYPSWAYIVVSFALLRFGFDEKAGYKQRLQNLFKTLFFYFIVSILYYLLIKIFIMFTVKELTNHNLAGRDFILQMHPEILWQRFIAIFKHLYHMPLSNFPNPSGLTLTLLIFFSLYSGFSSLIQNDTPRNKIIRGAGIFLLSLFILIISVSPLLFSHMIFFTTRYFIPWYMFFCVTSIFLIGKLANLLPQNIKKYLPAFLVIFVLTPVAGLQKEYSSIEVAIFNNEIGLFRSSVQNWYTQKGYINNRYVLVVRPQRERPAFIEKSWGTNSGFGENAVLASAENPVSIPWMFIAILRESPLGKNLGFVDCGFNQKCAEYYLSHDTIVLGITNGDVPIKTKFHPYIINLSTLTTKPIHPIIDYFGP